MHLSSTSFFTLIQIRGFSFRQPRLQMAELPFLCIVFLLLPISLITSQSLQSQRSNLLSTKQQWGNPPALSSWNATTSPCSWWGIQCSPGEVVTGITLSNASITGKIPPSICSDDLKNLTTLDLSWNYIPGEFPTQLYNCSALSYLDLSSNLFVGPIPDDVHRLSPSSLTHLNLSSNNFSGDIPTSIGRLTELRSLNMLYNLLNGTYPSEIGNLSKLEELQLAFNPFTPMKLPSEWGKLKSLKYLFMKECNLVGEIPESFGELESLEHLDLVGIRGDEIAGLVGQIPTGLFLLKNLSYLYLYKNKLSGEIPTVVQSLNLTEIDLSENNLTGSIPDDFGKLNQLRVLKLFNNQLQGEIPSSFGLLPQLEVLRLFYNNLSGPLPPDLGLHSNLQELQIGGNRFSGHLPQNLCSRRAFIGLTAFLNNLSGEIPKSLANCTTLGNLMLYNNTFTGEVPQGIWTLPNVNLLMLSFNNFTGQLPGHISWNLTRLELNNNNFSGSIPAGIATWTNIRVFRAGYNMLSGTVPLELTSLSNLNLLSLEGNQLSGSLPAKYISWTSLNTLNLAGNQLSGLIPSAIGTLSTLNYLDLASNHLSGEIPYQLGKLKLSFLNLSNNELSGEIPSSVESQADSNSFLNNTKLCTSDDETQISAVPKCVASRKTSSRHISSKYLAIILVLAAIVFLVGSYFSLFVINEIRQRKRGSKMTSWKLTSFQRLEFTEANIVSSLSEHNVIGSGGSGKVYRVSIVRSGKVVAVKKIWNSQSLDNSQFLAEVQILGTIRHSNIVKLLCSVCSEDTQLLVYEYLPNQSLDRWLHQIKRSETLGVLDWPKRMRIAVGAAQGLCYLHHDCSPPIIHRDVKSSNILLDSEFNAKIADFGLAKMTGKQGELPTSPDVAGSFGYLAPEYQYTDKVNEKVDVYSFGVVLLELATGKEPNGDGCLNLADSSWKHYKDEKPIVDALDKEMKQEGNLEGMVNVFKLGLMCTTTSPSSRPSMKEVVQMLRRFSPPEVDSMKPKMGNSERDVSPLLASDIDFSRYKNCRSKRGTEEDCFSIV